MRVSLVMLTYNRLEFLQRTMAHNMANAGYPLHELVWVDNGSSDGVHQVMSTYKPDVSILHKTNLGVSRGYNRGFALATGDYVLITDDDMLMPDNWLATFVSYLIAIPHTGVACMFRHELKRQQRRLESFNGVFYHPGTPWGTRIVRRDLLVQKIGYLREDFGLYGWEDVEWGQRALRVCRELGLLTYHIPGQYSEHLGTLGRDSAEYRAFKDQQGDDPRKQEVLERSKAQDYPYFNPYA
jgi:GT2 family glycosyltransferase